MSATLEKPVCDIVTEHPEVIPLFERLGIEYCCHGTHTLEEACAKKNLASADVVAEIEALDDNSTAPSEHEKSLGELCRYISEQHHGYARRQLPLIRELIGKVQRRHGISHPEVYFIGEMIAATEAELMHHFHCEEDVLFPYISMLEEDPTSSPPPMFQDISQPVKRMLSDHIHTGENLGLLREKTNNYQPPEDACTTFRALWKALEDLDKDLHLHIHLENNVLFPRALALAEHRA